METPLYTRHIYGTCVEKAARHDKAVWPIPGDCLAIQPPFSGLKQTIEQRKKPTKITRRNWSTSTRTYYIMASCCTLISCHILFLDMAPAQLDGVRWSQEHPGAWFPPPPVRVLWHPTASPASPEVPKRRNLHPWNDWWEVAGKIIYKLLEMIGLHRFYGVYDRYSTVCFWKEWLSIGNTHHSTDWCKYNPLNPLFNESSTNH